MRGVTALSSAPQVAQETRSRTTGPLWLIVAAFAAVYVIWGSTYLGIRLAIDSIPPFLMAGARFLIAGLLLYGAMRMAGAAAPKAGHWKSAAVLGGLLLLAGNGGVSWAQQTVPSGLTALVVAAVPLWIMLVDWLRPRGIRPNRLVLLGLIAGFAGVVLLIAGKNQHGQRMVDPVGAVVLVGATLCWALGSVYSRHAQKPASALLAVGMQMIAGGGLQLATGFALGEAAQFSWARITPASGWAFLYLTLVGSLVGFTAYVWLLQVSTPAKVSTYAYVNPLIAVALGHLVLHEEVPKSAAMAGTLVLAAVILITRRPSASRSLATLAPESR
jgi:drug/metabolite transporter (DMT)-like permease